MNVVKTLCLMVMLTVLATASSAAVLWQDDFSTDDQWPIAGYLSDQWVAAEITGGEAHLAPGTLAPDHNFTDAAITNGGGFTVQFDMDPWVNGSWSGSEWCGLAIGMTNTAPSDPMSVINGYAITTAPFGLQVNKNGSVGVWSNGSIATVQNYTWYDPATGPSGTFTFRLDVTTDSFAAGSSANAVLSIVVGNDSYVVDLGGQGTGSIDFNWLTGSNYMGFSNPHGNTDAMIDNLVVTAVPEPVSLSLLGVGALAVLKRKRK